MPLGVRTFTLLLLTLCSCESDIFKNDENVETVNKAIAIRGTFPIIAHRGCWSGESTLPNSIAAFKKALAENIYGTEFDVYETADKTLVVNHEAKYDGLNIRATAYSTLTATKLTNGEQIPTLEEFINAHIEAGTKVKMIVDLKDCNVYDVIALCEQYDVMSKIIFISF